MGVVGACPACTPEVVCSAFGVIGQDAMGADDEAVPLEAHSMGDMGYGRRGVAAVGVVQLCESIEAVFRVDVATAEREDLVRRGSQVGVDRIWPREV